MSEKKVFYRCEYSLDYFKNEKRNLRRVISDGGIDDFKDGFWIDKKYKFTKGSDCMLWIPPSKIRYIHKDYN